MRRDRTMSNTRAEITDPDAMGTGRERERRLADGDALRNIRSAEWGTNYGTERERRLAAH